MTKKHLYAIGIAGVGVSAVARWYLQKGWRVSGSDPRPSPLVDDLRSLGADIVQIPMASRLADVDLVVYTDDVPVDQVERQEATRRGIPAASFAEALGTIMQDRPERLTVAGTNGKSTTSALLGIIVASVDRDPTVFVGSRVKEFSGNMRIGQGPHFIAEADEYRDHFLNFSPTAALITNVELDHVEYFKTVERMEDSYRQFLQKLPPQAPIIYNQDDPGAVRVCAEYSQAISFGFSDQADARIVAYSSAAEQETFQIAYAGETSQKFTLHVPGRFNVLNAVGAVMMAHAHGIPINDCIAAVGAFRGIWRRFEVLNPGAGTLVINDYAHHPTSVRATIGGARVFYPQRRIIAVFQPHHRHRLQALFHEFATAFESAHEIIITDVYAVPGREDDDPTLPTSRDLVAAMTASGWNVHYAPSLTDVANTIAAIVKPGDAIVLMGAGDIWTLAQPLIDVYG